ncbi:MAG: FliH/SctL family protein [Candidatus Baltobacteraceae bacterium]
MPDEFVSLAVFLRPPAPPFAPPAATPVETAGEPQDRGGERELNSIVEEAVRSARRFRAALADALDAAVERLLAEIASGVLARELRIADADVASLVASALERFSSERVLSVRVHPHAAAALGDSLALEIVADQALLESDLILELHSGTIDMRLRARLARALAACVP